MLIESSSQVNQLSKNGLVLVEGAEVMEKGTDGGSNPTFVINTMKT